MKNCQGTDQAKIASLSELLALLRALMRKGAFPSSLLDPIYKSLSGIVQAKYGAGLNGSSLRDIVDRYLPLATAQALAAAKGGSAAPTQSFGAGNRGAGGALLAGLVSGAEGAGGFFDPARTDPRSGALASAIPAAATGGEARAVGGVAVGGLAVTSDEVRDYFNGVVRGDDDSFAVLLWLGAGKNPMLQLEALSYAKRLHNDVILPAATYYKSMIYGDPNYPIRLGQILYGIVPKKVVTTNLQGGPPSRHLIGQAVNFKIIGVQDAKVVEDLASGRIPARFGTLALTSGIHASLPFYAANDAVVRNLLLWTDNGVPDFVGYQFN